jgi:hypothetical protein
VALSTVGAGFRLGASGPVMPGSMFVDSFVSVAPSSQFGVQPARSI